jgi:hypothetical protein
VDQTYVVSEVSIKACKEAERTPFGLAVFPGDVNPIGIAEKLSESDIIKSTQAVVKDTSGLMGGFGINIFICIAYQDMESAGFHHTYYSAFIASYYPGSPLPVLANHGVIHASDVIIRNMPNSQPPD